MIGLLLGVVFLFLVVWAAVYSGTKAALRSFFRREYYDLDDEGARRIEKDDR